MADSTFYPTYEEWKHVTPSDNVVDEDFLFILPMRNGNWSKTSKIPTLDLLFILPMRNGNFWKCCRIYSGFCFLSYLWGMETFFFRFFVKFTFLSFYPTYEEWKLRIFHTLEVFSYLPFYPTYEEWKPCKSLYLFVLQNAFYPTYEEWKLCSF